MKPRTWGYFILEALRSIFRNTWMSLASVGVVIITLFLLGSFMLLNYNIDFLSSDIKSQIEVVVVLDEDLPRTQVDQLHTKIKGFEGIQEVTFVSREEALERLRIQMGEQSHLLEGYENQGNNPLWDSFEVKTVVPEDVPKLAGEIEGLSGVVRVDYGSEVLEKLFSITRILNWVGVAFMIGLAVSATFLIANTIKLTVFTRKQEITIMKTVGATDWFIRWPFVIEGLVLGVIGSLVPVVGLFYGYRYIVEWVAINIPFLSLMPVMDVFNFLLQTLFILGIGLGVLGSSFSLRKFLKV
ncbi:permease-like cell division protein FtsX [Candidatus Contubernalis alkaliaceticus]|uniref:permease-like cell division protein FtsX n=1 Tax=Candidatus Contubernalis alkaliaceticus TaxID=338645 RepID=UPI001F4C1396|nr:permease-like cell division protein FtsX [Candidatus Contubernalis alkalaceticus]UNC90775.1 ABC transporter permease [Candidatus Contubernalis alkalaceticus]